ncbi:hypothetical protein [Nocardia arthritidis]|uniref:Uncharacterized protein n=1 Tax=Nocardia arthritidis TaxID=228602 RepID=A0A6G9YAG8_9NOCA|nr:hypothetical protein [Nocardia arthritidis]QIS10144.1 hypothetical protein F5544_11250 [Nocardia arthritidis]
MIVAGVLAGAVSFGAPGWVAPAAAKPDTVVMTCDETGNVTWLGAGITDTKAKVDWENTKHYDNCKLPDGSTPQVYPERSVAMGTELASCDAVESHEGRGEMSWSDGSTTTFKQKASKQSKFKGNGTGEFTLIIEDGNDFTGDTAIDKDTLTKKESKSCPGLTSATTKGTLTIYK